MDTVKKIKEDCVNLGVTPPHGLVKNKLVDYRNNLIYSLYNNIPIKINTNGQTACRVDKINNSHIGTLEYESIYMNLKDNEYNSVYYRDKLYSWIESISPEFSRYDSNTQNIPLNQKGIFQNYIGQENFIWETNDLLSSFDGDCFLPYKRQDSWLHLDQSKYVGDRAFCIQGLVTLTESGPNDGGLLLLEGFQAHYKIDINDSNMKKCKPIKICAPPGYMIIWESRMCIYVSMSPKENCNQEYMKKRIKAAMDNRMTGHWCYGDGFKVNPVHPHTRGAIYPKPSIIAGYNKILNDEYINNTKLTPLIKQLIGI